MSLQRPFLTCINYDGMIYCIHVILMRLNLFFVCAVAWTQHASRVLVCLTHDTGGAILRTFILKLVAELGMLDRSLCMRQDTSSSFLCFEYSVWELL